MEDKIILYHRVMRRENFEKATRDLFDLLKTAQVKSPNIDRILYVDIDGHKNSKGGFDHDMFELQQDFGIGFLGKFFSEVHFPLINFINPNPQCNNIPAGLSIFSPESQHNNQLNNLYIENYSNTEFISEPDVYNYLQKVHNFLIEYMKKGFVLNDERLKNPKEFGADYFDELLERIRDIRASERRIYQKVKDIFALSPYERRAPC